MGKAKLRTTGIDSLSFSTLWLNILKNVNTVQNILKSSYGVNKFYRLPSVLRKERRRDIWIDCCLEFNFSEWPNQWRSLYMRPQRDGDSSPIWWTQDGALCVEKRALALVGFAGVMSLERVAVAAALHCVTPVWRSATPLWIKGHGKR